MLSWKRGERQAYRDEFVAFVRSCQLSEYPEQTPAVGHEQLRQHLSTGLERRLIFYLQTVHRYSRARYRVNAPIPDLDTGEGRSRKFVLRQNSSEGESLAKMFTTFGARAGLRNFLKCRSFMVPQR